MDPSIKEELFSRIDVLAKKLGVGAEHLWAVLIKQSIISGWSDFILQGVLLILLLIGLNLILRVKGSLYDTYNNGFTTKGMTFMLYLSILGFILTITILDFKNNLIQILNPEYYAWKEIQSILR